MNDLDVAIAVVEEGAAVVRRRFGTTLQRLDKGAGDFATSADIEAENAMLCFIANDRRMSLSEKRVDELVQSVDCVRG
jgi:myo-inositol-1(or 4)-monophosphatase